MNKSGAETISIRTHVKALMPLASLINPARIAPTMPPISKTIDNSALFSGDNEAKNKIN
jgi:hypothetical protein